jgi:hypothetical protein
VYVVSNLYKIIVECVHNSVQIGSTLSLDT